MNLIWVYFISVSFLIAMVKTSKTMLNNNDNNSILVFFLILEEMLSVFHHWEHLLWVAILSGGRLLNGGRFLLCLLSGEFFFFFNHNLVLNFVESYSASVEMIVSIFFLFVNMVYPIDSFSYVDESLHQLRTSHLIILHDPFNVLLDYIC